jgi:capping protein beta
LEDGDDGFKPSEGLRELEVMANQLFDGYRELYFEGGHSSVYLWDVEEEESASTQEVGLTSGSFAGCFLIKKDVDPSVGARSNLASGGWNSIHVIEAGVPGPQDAKGIAKANYKLTTTVMITMNSPKESDMGNTSLSGTLTRQTSQVMSVDCKTGIDNHLTNIGKLIEETEIELRLNIDSLYIQKTREVVNNLRDVTGGVNQGGKDHVMGLNAAVMKHGEGRKIDSEENM